MGDLSDILLVALVIGAAIAVPHYLGVVRRGQRAAFLREYVFPHGLKAKLLRKHKDLRDKDHHLVSQALRQFFAAYQSSGYRKVGMPSRVADDLWHEFILFTKDYGEFCQKAFGRFFHHVPNSAGSEADNQAALARTWRECCQAEGIAPRSPSRLPLLFAIDAKLGIPGAVPFALPQDRDREPLASTSNDGAYVAPVFIDSFWGSDSNDSGGSDSSSGDAGGGDSGGSSCGGGCGGGGD